MLEAWRKGRGGLRAQEEGTFAEAVSKLMLQGFRIKYYS